MIVAQRPLLGYNAEIELDLEFSPDAYKVRIMDSCGVVEWSPASRREAADMYFHPFAYGYTDPTITLGDDDS